jgi:hypothetical protein
MEIPKEIKPENCSPGYPTHYAKRVPDLDHEDLLTIKYLIDNFGMEKIPIFSKKLQRKIQESLSIYEWEQKLIKKAEKEKDKISMKEFFNKIKKDVVN